MSTGVITDSTDAIVNGVVMAMAPVHLQGIPMGYSRRVIRIRFLHAHPEGILGVEVENTVVLDIDLRNTVIGGGE